MAGHGLCCAATSDPSLVSLISLLSCPCDSLPKWQPLGEELIRRTGWKREWLPSKLQTMWHNLSARTHDVQCVQGGEMQAVVISLKVASGERGPSPSHILVST